MKYVWTVCILALASLAHWPAVTAAELTKEPLSTIKVNLEEGEAVLVDVREKNEWDKGHIHNAIFLPSSRIQDGLTAEELESLPKDKILYVHCVVGKRALSAANSLQRHGYKVRPMKPGYKEMISAGFPNAKQ